MCILLTLGHLVRGLVKGLQRARKKYNLNNLNKSDYTLGNVKASAGQRLAEHWNTSRTHYDCFLIALRNRVVQCRSTTKTRSIKEYDHVFKKQHGCHYAWYNCDSIGYMA